MVKYYNNPLDYIFFALSDSIRRDILMQLKSSQKSVSELARPFDVSLPAISKHLKVLERAKLLKRFKRGRCYFFSINKEGLESAEEWVKYFEQFWTENLENLDIFLLSQESKK